MVLALVVPVLMLALLLGMDMFEECLFRPRHKPGQKPAPPPSVPSPETTEAPPPAVPE
jgi:hypothetical protein